MRQQVLSVVVVVTSNNVWETSERSMIKQSQTIEALKLISQMTEMIDDR
jgi:hypothetical protein